MTLTATYISASSFIGGPGAALYKYTGLGLAGDDPASRRLLAFTGYSWVKIRYPARRYNAVTLNDMLFARYQSRLLRGWQAQLIGRAYWRNTALRIGGARLLETAAREFHETGLLIYGVSIALPIRRLAAFAPAYL